jgi:hypothetical protein
MAQLFLRIYQVQKQNESGEKVMATPKSTLGTEIIPYIFYRDVSAALEWLTRAFGFAEIMRTTTPNGGTHGEMTLVASASCWGRAARNGEW